MAGIAVDNVAAPPPVGEPQHGYEDTVSPAAEIEIKCEAGTSSVPAINNSRVTNVPGGAGAGMLGIVAPEQVASADPLAVDDTCDLWLCCDHEGSPFTDSDEDLHPF